MQYRDRIPLAELQTYAAALNTRAKALHRTERLTAEVLRGVILDAGGHCAWCGVSLVGRDFEIDHVTPLSRGGPHTAANLVLACAACNRRKGEKAPLSFAHEQAARGAQTRLVAHLLAQHGETAHRQQSLFGDDPPTDADAGTDAPAAWVYTPPET